ncbi:hypothetical protein SBD_0115 [Streptomyces bottropensis ATCC 25435]|uniref:Uncharacterized protein n=1 Tax=Streptomyces bottropensis ATCC 25435 TaxID=1054862 RepID=M3F738_9ACTN|nr:hypothetical protein SBD_0115 [Streptomyces bottropensis ATCC 25435]
MAADDQYAGDQDRSVVASKAGVTAWSSSTAERPRRRRR